MESGGQDVNEDFKGRVYPLKGRFRHCAKSPHGYRALECQPCQVTHM